MWGTQEGINKAWLGRKPYVFLSKACTVEPIIGSSQHVDKSCDYEFLQPWLGTGLLTSSGNVINVNNLYWLSSVVARLDKRKGLVSLDLFLSF
jgi:hypothetical protein